MSRNAVRLSGEIKIDRAGLAVDHRHAFFGSQIRSSDKRLAPNKNPSRHDRNGNVRCCRESPWNFGCSRLADQAPPTRRYNPNARSGSVTLPWTVPLNCRNVRSKCPTSAAVTKTLFGSRRHQFKSAVKKERRRTIRRPILLFGTRPSLGRTRPPPARFEKEPAPPAFGFALRLTERNPPVPKFAGVAGDGDRAVEISAVGQRCVRVGDVGVAWRRWLSALPAIKPGA